MTVITENNMVQLFNWSMPFTMLCVHVPVFLYFP